MNATQIPAQGDLNDLFRATILEHSRHPRNYGAGLAAPDIEQRAVNASCGDRVTLRLSVDTAERITAIEWDGQGCAISQASVSMMTRAVQGKSLAEAERIVAAFRAFLKGEETPNDVRLGELAALTGVRQFPTRVRCALLGWQALATGIAEYRARAPENDGTSTV